MKKGCFFVSISFFFARLLFFALRLLFLWNDFWDFMLHLVVWLIFFSFRKNEIQNRQSICEYMQPIKLQFPFSSFMESSIKLCNYQTRELSVANMAKPKPFYIFLGLLTICKSSRRFFFLHHSMSPNDEMQKTICLERYHFWLHFQI